MSRMRPSTPSLLLALSTVLGLATAGRAQPLECVVYTQDRRIPVLRPRGEWFNPERVQRIEVSARGGGPVGASLEAWTGSQAWPLLTDPHKFVEVLEVDDPIRKAWRAHGALVVGFAAQWKAGGELVLRAPPRRLDLPAKETVLTVVQRRSAPLPGSDGYLEVRIDDITAGQVLVEVRGADGQTFVARRSVRKGDHVEIDLESERYVLVLDRFVNFLIGDDFADFRICERGHFERGRIETLIRRIASADVTFVREGEEYGGEEAAEHIRAKYGRVRDKVRTLDQFIDEVASRSWTTGRPYRVRYPDGRTVPAADWLREQAAGLPQGETAEEKKPTAEEKPPEGRRP